MTAHDVYYDNGRRRVGYWYAAILGVVVALIGLLLLAGGVWLIALGGSWYYAVAGIGLIASGGLLMLGRMAGVWVYVVTWLFTLVWAFWEVGLDGWALVPRIVAPTVLLLLVLACIPALRRPRRAEDEASYRGAVAAGVLFVALGGVAGFHYLSEPSAAIAQDTTPEAPADESGAASEEPALRPLVEPQQAQEQPADDPGAEATPDTGDREVTEGATGSRDDVPPVENLADPDLEPGLRAQNQPMDPLETGENWPAYGGTYHGTRYSPLNQINRQNVANLERIWTYRTGDMPEDYSDRGVEEEPDFAPETTPLKVGNDIYLCSAMNILIAIDAATGREEWRYDPGVSPDAIPYSASCRGVAYYETPGAARDEPCGARVIEGTLDARLIAVDARTGQPCTDFGLNGVVYLEKGMGATVPSWVSVTSPPTIVRGVVVVGHQVLDNQAEDAPSGVVRGYDAVTGELAWAWDMEKPNLKGEPPEGETYSRGTPNMWTIAAGDDELGHVYLPMGNSSVDYYGANRSAIENEYATALVAIDVATGEPVWRFQTVHYDVWDYDLGSQPALVDFPRDGETIPALVLSSKQGEIYVLDRRTGESLFPVEERPVPQGGVEPQNLSPTQPFSAYHTLLMPPLEEEDMWGMSPLDQLWCRIQFRRAIYDGVYTPPTTDQHWIQYPGYNGGQDWGSLGVDLERGILIANYNDMPNYNRLIPREQIQDLGVRPVNDPVGQSEDAPNDLSPQAGAPYGIDVNAGWRLDFTGLMCKAPPYGGIRAIDLATGETLWDRPFGTARANGPFGIPSKLPFLIGTPNNGGPLVTAGGLIFIAAATDNLLRAIDIETGEVVWQDVLPAGGQATPITYEADGRQFVAFMAGGHHFMETPIGDYVLGYALPEEGQ